MSINKKLSDFLHNLASSVENNKLTSNQLRDISQFRADYLFQNGTDNKTDNSTDNITNKQAMKYFTLGWYIYNIESLKNL